MQHTSKQKIIQLLQGSWIDSEGLEIDIVGEKIFFKPETRYKPDIIKIDWIDNVGTYTFRVDSIIWVNCYIRDIGNDIFGCTKINTYI